MKRRKSKGFTLIELLVVIAIIGILSSVVLASLNTARKKSRDAKRISDIRQLQLALEFYYDANANYPLALSIANLVTPGFIAMIPTPPAGAGETAYNYAALGSGTSCTGYHLGATLEDSSNTVFNGDVDRTAGTVCTGGGTDFNGVNGSCSASTGTDTCYDQAP